MANLMILQIALRCNKTKLNFEGYKRELRGTPQIILADKPKYQFARVGCDYQKNMT